MSIIITLAALFIILVTIRPLKIKKVVINMAVGSVLVIFLLYVLGVIDIDTIYSGIIGNGSIEPWKIIVIFFSVAYISISTDITGIFDYCAYKIVHVANGNGFKLFIFFYLFAGLLSIVTSNDIVILTLTPIIFYLSKHAKIDVIPLLFAEFFAANTFSMFFYIDNPTNIMVVNAMGIGFLEYARVMFWPTIVAGLTTGLILVALFRKEITLKFKIKKTSKFKIRSKFDAGLSVFMMVLMLIILILSDTLFLPIWLITLCFAILFMVEDLFFSIYYYVRSKDLSALQINKNEEVFNIPKEKNELIMALKRMPWSILPFILAFFIIVESLSQLGIISQLASFISSYLDSLFSSVAVTGVLSLITVNIINNQPMTILFSNVLVNNSFIADPINIKAATYSLVVASNLGANITIVGALAGLMWKKILKVKGIEISYLDFLKKGIIVTPIVFIITLLTLLLVLKY